MGHTGNARGLLLALRSGITDSAAEDQTWLDACKANILPAELSLQLHLNFLKLFFDLEISKNLVYFGQKKMFWGLNISLSSTE